MSALTFEELRRVNVERCESSDGFGHKVAEWTPNDWAVACTGELGELCNLLKKRRRGECIIDFDIGEEIADVAIYLDLLAASLGIDLATVVRDKFNVVSERIDYEGPGL